MSWGRIRRWDTQHRERGFWKIVRLRRFTLNSEMHETEETVTSHVALLEWNKWVKLGAKLVRDQAKACDLGFIHS